MSKLLGRAELEFMGVTFVLVLHGDEPANPVANRIKTSKFDGEDSWSLTVSNAFASVPTKVARSQRARWWAQYEPTTR